MPCNSPIHKACIKGDYVEVKSLLDDDIDVNTKGMLGRTPLHFACEFGQTAIAELLMKRGAFLEAADNVILISFISLHTTYRFLSHEALIIIHMIQRTALPLFILPATKITKRPQ